MTGTDVIYYSKAIVTAILKITNLLLGMGSQPGSNVSCVFRTQGYVRMPKMIAQPETRESCSGQLWQYIAYKPRTCLQSGMDT